MVCFTLLNPIFIFGQLKADFSLDKTESCDFLIPVITNLSKQGSAPIKTFSWDLAGTSLIFDNPNPPTRQFFKPGINTICLTVTDSDNKTDKICKNIIIFSPPVISVIPSISSGCAPLTVDFKNLSFSPNGNIKELIWNIGGASNTVTSTSNISQVSTTYNNPGLQNITVKATDEKNCSVTKTFEKIVNVVSPKPVIPTIRYLNTCTLPWSVIIRNSNSEEDVSYEWDFGNGKRYTGPQPDTVFYNTEGVFNLEVRAKKNDCISVFKFENFVTTIRDKNLKLNLDTICAGIESQLNSNQISGIDKVEWIINDTLVSNEEKLRYKFFMPGCNNIKVIRTRNRCIDTLKNECFFVKSQQKVNYAVSGNNTCLLPAKVNVNGDGNAKWKWSSTIQQIDSSSGNFVFDKFGDYMIYLSIRSENNCEIKDSFPVKIKKFEVELPKTGPQGCAPQSFVLKDSIFSEVPLVNYHWKIFTKDTLKFDVKTPEFTINETGRYDIQLVVRNSIGCIDTVRKNQYLGVGTPPVVNFDANPKNDCRKTGRKFSDLSGNNGNYWFWDFGDGGTSLEKNPEYKYNDTGYFDVKLLVGHNGCFSSKQIDSFMYIKAPVIGWSPIINCEDPLNVKIVSNSIAADTLYWVISDLNNQEKDTFNTRTVESLKFPDFGKYIVGIYAENYTTGCTDETIDTLFLTNPVAFYELDKYKGCAPFETNIKFRGSDIDTIQFFWQNEKISNLVLPLDKEGIYPTPVMVGKDRYGCPDTFKIDSVLIASAIQLDVVAPDAVCVPDSFHLVNLSKSSFGFFTEQTWTINGRLTGNLDSISYFADSAVFYKVELNLKDDFGCKSNSINEVQGIDLKPKIIRDSLGCTKGDIRLAAGGTTAFTKTNIWTLGDGNQEQDKFDLAYRYESEGKYEICLTLADERGCSKQVCDSLQILDPIADFKADSIEANCPPLITNFTNLSKNSNYYFWLFGDNSTSDQTNPSHIYNKVDTFDVMLVSGNSPTCKDTLLIKGYIKVKGPQAEIYPEFLSYCTPLQVRINIKSDKPYVYLWDNDIGDVEKPDYKSTNDSRVYEYSKPGRYRPRAIVTNDEGCSLLYQSPEFEVNDLINNFILEDFPLCEGVVTPKIQNLTTSTADSFNSIWILERENFASTRFDKNPTFTIMDRGFYKLTLITEVENCRDTVVKEDFIFLGTPPVPDFTIPNLLCQNKEFVLENKTDTSLQGKISLDWKNVSNKSIGTDEVLRILPDTSGNIPIKLIIKNEANCVDSISKTLFVNQGLQIKISPDTIVCIGEPVNIINKISGSNLKNYKLSSLEKIICENCSNHNFVPEVDNFYYLDAENNVGCIYSDSIKIDIAPVKAPQFDLIHPGIICEDSIANISVSPLPEDWSAIWTNSKGDTLCKNNCSTIFYPVSFSDQVRIKMINKTYLCSTSKTSDIKIESSIPDFLTDFKTVCLGDSVMLTAKDGVKFNWNVRGHTVCDTCKQIKFLPDRPTLTTLNLVSSTGCPYSDSVIVNVFDKRLIYAGPDTAVCKDAEIKLKGWGFGNVVWSPSHLLTNPESYTPTFKADTSMFFKMNTINDECILTDSLFVNVIPKIDLTVTNDTICPGDISTIHYTTNGSSVNYRFSKIPREFKLMDKSMEIFPESSLSVIWTAKYPTCKDVMDTSFIVMKEPVRYYLDKKYYEISFNNIQQVKAKFDTTQIKSYTIQWREKTGLSCYNCPQPFISDITENQSFPVMITDPETGCFIIDSIYTRLIKKCTPDGFFLPNIMRLSSINGNNTFDFNAHKIDQFKSLQIFDRWGNKVFQTEDVNERWNGYFDGVPVTTGVYVVKITANCPEDLLDYVIYGDVTVIP